MRKIVTIVVILVSQLLIDGCLQNEALFQDPPIDQILGGKEFVVYNGMIVFSDYETFKSISNIVASKSDQELNDWEKSISFKSLRYIFNETIENEIEFVESQAEKTSNVNLDRNTLGFLPETKKYLDKGVFYIDEYETVSMNVSDDYLGALVNKDGLVRIGDNIILFQRDLVKTLKVLEPSKIQLLYAAKQTDVSNGISVSEVKRIVNFESRISGNNKTQIIGSCVSTVDNYRLYVYEEWTAVYPDIVTCTSGPLNTYKIKLRSLKKTLGIWNNYNTGFMRLNGSLKARHVAYCDGQTPTTNHVLSDQLNYSYTCPYGNTCYKYFFVAYDMGTCSVFVCGDPYNLSFSFWHNIVFDARSHTGFGYNNTSCYVGN